jgi:hypothetical protein
LENTAFLQENFSVHSTSATLLDENRAFDILLDFILNAEMQFPIGFRSSAVPILIHSILSTITGATQFLSSRDQTCSGEESPSAPMHTIRHITVPQTEVSA